MKKACLLILYISILYSCNKNSSSPNTIPINISGLPKAYTRYYAETHIISYHIFKYDSNNNLAGISLLQYDTAGGIVFVDSGSYYFSVDPVADLPTGYTSVYLQHSKTQAQIETHALYFNNQKQVIKDSGVSVLSGDNQNAATKYYTYSANTFVSNWYSHATPGWNKFLIDSVITSNGNVASGIQYDNNGSGNNWVVSSQYTETDYSTYPNPFFDQGLSYSFGAFLLMEGINDFLSKNLANDSGFVWTTDTKGRVITGLAPDGSYVQYTYQ
jgi:hypothetical protein